MAASFTKETGGSTNSVLQNYSRFGCPSKASLLRRIRALKENII